MLFESKFALYQVFVRPEIPHYHDVTGVQTGTTKALIAEFGSVGEGFEFANWLEGGKKDQGVEIRGHYFDSDEAAARLNWTDDERESVETVLLEQCIKTPTWVWQVTRAPAAPSPPWATYDDTHHWKIPGVAADLNLIHEALAYETATKNREGVTQPLEEKLAELQDTMLTATT